MPRFTDAEREAIQKTILEEGQRLFAAHGLKKVTADDISKAANISTGSFYNFYSNKEHLFVTINFNLQTQLFAELREYLAANRHLAPAEMVGIAFKHFYKRAMEYPILPDIDMAVISHLKRKLPPEVFEEHTLDDAAIVDMLKDYGITFKQDSVLIAKAMQTIYGCSTTLVGDDDFEAVIDILVSGLVAQVQQPEK